MATLRIFGDEAGTMPMDDNDGPFVTATISVLGEPPIINKPDGHVGWLFEKLKEFDASPSISFVDPIPGYGPAIKSKYSKMNTMARLTRLITGANRPYLTEQGIQPRNQVWLFCMEQSIGQATVYALTKDKIDRVAIVLDQKSMAKPHRKLFETSVRRISNHLDGVLERVKQLYPKEAGLYKSRLLFSKDTISITWSDDPSAIGSEGGLKLSHYLASHYYQGLSQGNMIALKEHLAEAGYVDIEKDLTKMIIDPINRASIERWERNTGLPEPEG